MVNAPLALGVKELKPGTVGSRVIIRFDNNAPAPRRARACVRVPELARAQTEWAIAKSDKAGIDPLVSQALRDDLAAQYVKLAPKP